MECWSDKRWANRDPHSTTPKLLTPKFRLVFDNTYAYYRRILGDKEL